MSKYIFISSDHAGYLLKEQIYKFLIKKKYFIKNLGPKTNKSVDYPDFSRSLALEIKKKPGSFGLLFCGTGIGMSIAANRFEHIRAALCTDLNMVSLSRRHNDANVLVIGGRTTTLVLAQKMTSKFLNTDFEFGRHQLRINKLTKGEGKHV